MKIGIPKEIKNNEFRVAITPNGVKKLINKGHEVIVEKNAGIESNFSNKEYQKSGAEICKTPDEVYNNSDMILKVKEPIEIEYNKIKENQIVFTYFHFASNENLTRAMLNNKSICIAYETVEKENGVLPLLKPMSEVAGRMAAQEGAKYLEKPMGGRGILLGGVENVLPAKVLIIGGGISGTEAAKMCSGLQANVTILDTDESKIKKLNEEMPANVKAILSNKNILFNHAVKSDLIIGAVLVTGGKAPKLIKKTMLKDLKKGCVLVDIAIDQGGCFETSKPTTHQNPTYLIDGILHYCVANMPGAVPYTSTLALTNKTLPYIIEIAEKGWKKACEENIELKKGLNIISNNVVYKEVSDAFNLKYTDISNFI